ncbi:GAF and ANTAR domain-containing protein [Actinomycetospora sp. OC33-EN08]|uniref:GAF and ANTAR domain-containing protein n=1 Tax=Actinomycetospora aurantiaca TaxID=3129233 RepID=A0ABU8MX66_9PSEU
MDNEEMLRCLRVAARELASKRSIRDLQLTLAHIVEAAVETIPPVEAGGISLTEDGGVTSQHPTSEAVRELDGLQSRLQEGPCITAMIDPPEDGIVVALDLGGKDAERWPGFAPTAVEMGLRSLMSTQLSSEGGPRAALNLYAAEPEAFDAEARLMAGLFGVQVAMLLYGAEQARHLQQAVDSRDLIGQAKGILMERFALDDDGAFRMLVRSSKDTNMKLVEVARWLHDEATQKAAVPEEGPPAR